MGVGLLGASVICSLIQIASAASCQLVLHVNATESPLVLGGAVTAPVSSQMTLGNPDASTGFYGQLLLTVPAACPTDATSLLAQLDGAQLQTGNTSLQVYPEAIKVRGGAVPPSLLRAPSRPTHPPLLNA